MKLQEYRTALAGISLPNNTNVSFHESMGFRPVGIYKNVGYKAKQWHDIGWWKKQLSQYDHSPTDPISFPEIINNLNTQ